MIKELDTSYIEINASPKSTEAMGSAISGEGGNFILIQDPRGLSETLEPEQIVIPPRYRSPRPVAKSPKVSYPGVALLPISLATLPAGGKPPSDTQFQLPPFSTSHLSPLW